MDYTYFVFQGTAALTLFISQSDLLCCDYCEKGYHLQCHIPPIVDIPTGYWKCQECAAVEYNRKMKCGECEACVRDDCGKCNMCLDKPKVSSLQFIVVFDPSSCSGQM